MRESWTDHFEYSDIYKLVKKISPKAKDIVVLEYVDENGYMIFEAKYTLEKEGKEGFVFQHIGPYGEMNSLDPNDGEHFFNIAKKKNKGRTIDGETFEQAYIRVYKEAIEEQRRSLIEEAKKEKIFEARFNKIYAAEYLSNTLLNKVASFVVKHGIKNVESEPNC